MRRPVPIDAAASREGIGPRWTIQRSTTLCWLADRPAARSCRLQVLHPSGHSERLHRPEDARRAAGGRDAGMASRTNSSARMLPHGLVGYMFSVRQAVDQAGDERTGDEKQSARGCCEDASYWLDTGQFCRKFGRMLRIHRQQASGNRIKFRWLDRKKNNVVSNVLP